MIIGLTGGIGSGKSTVADLFKELGVPVVDADQVSRELVKPGSKILNNIVEHFGPKILNAEGELDRSLLRKKIFDKPDDKIFIEKLLHPVIYKKIQEFAEEHPAPYIIAVIPLLIETREKYNIDIIKKVLVVDAPEDLQVDRVRKRDKLSSTEIRKIMHTQIDRQARLNRANDIIINDGDLNKLRKQVLELDAKYGMIA